MQKKAYLAPALIITTFEVDDIITSSGLALQPGDNEFLAPDTWWDN